MDNIASNEVILHTITVLPIEVGEQGFKNLESYIKENYGNNSTETYENMLPEKVVLSDDFLRDAPPDKRVTHIAKLNRLKEVESNQEKSIAIDEELTSDLYSLKIKTDTIPNHSSVCIVREEKEVLDRSESLEDIIYTTELRRDSLDRLIKVWNGLVESWEDPDNEEVSEKLEDLSPEFSMYIDALYDLGFRPEEKENRSQDGPAFHYTFYIVNCKKEDEDWAKEIAYNLNASILYTGSGSSKLLGLADARLKEAFAKKIDSPLELYLLTSSSAFTMLCVDIDNKNDISEFAKCAAIRAQSVRNLCYYYTEVASENLSYAVGHKLSYLAETTLTRPISSTSEVLSDRILEDLIEPANIPTLLNSFHELVISKKAKEESDSRQQERDLREKEREDRERAREEERDYRESAREKDREDRERSRAILGSLIAIIGFFIPIFATDISFKTVAIVTLIAIASIVLIALVIIIFIAFFGNKRGERFQALKKMFRSIFDKTLGKIINVIFRKK